LPKNVVSGASNNYYRLRAERKPLDPVCRRSA
jgi:hypothetical protein